MGRLFFGVVLGMAIMMALVNWENEKKLHWIVVAMFGLCAFILFASIFDFHGFPNW